MAYVRGSSRATSTSPVTESPLKSPTSVAPAARRRSPPKPVIVTPGAHRRSSVAREAAYRSPDGSPQEIITRNGGASESTRLAEQRGFERDVELDAAEDPLDERRAVAAHFRLERDLYAVHDTVVRIPLFHRRGLHVVALHEDEQRVGIEDEAHRTHPASLDEEDRQLPLPVDLVGGAGCAHASVDQAEQQ